MEHPNDKVARASHSVFMTFMTMGKDSEESDKASLKELLVFHYMQRSLVVLHSAKNYLNPKSLGLIIWNLFLCYCLM